MTGDRSLLFEKTGLRRRTGSCRHVSYDKKKKLSFDSRLIITFFVRWEPYSQNRLWVLYKCFDTFFNFFCLFFHWVSVKQNFKFWKMDSFVALCSMYIEYRSYQIRPKMTRLTQKKKIYFEKKTKTKTKQILYMIKKVSFDT